MSLNTKAAAFLATDAARASLTRLYGHNEAVLAHQTERYNALAQRHIELFGEKDGMRFVSAPGAAAGGKLRRPRACRRRQSGHRGCRHAQ